ncbi:MAG: SDR family NAD(P)-dependent oxidoreductase [SAR202 cluster bacterium]|jgi:3-oxoacyl-[acyl-carrier protein] reductase|nr:SDR family NAD(P)-dependent oxidoreductase [SAR202 cluster bacterium]MDP7414932.1 SDR family NAD(P)-dependent oxidoreductase [SAR202 cluster bacterium]MDP7533727.1 SDR family NAD(P)-dependent oxidoreductase [SAR202 cluster bacterium]
MQLEGKTAIVTGGGRGIGRSIALAYAQEGADVAVVARTPDEVEAVAVEIRTLGRKGVALLADLTVSEEVTAMFQEAVEALGSVDIMVNNAGGYRLYTTELAHQISVVDLSEEEWHRVVAANLTTAFLCCKTALPHMIERGSGVIINMSSGVGKRGRPGGAVYSAAKSAVERLTESLADEVWEFGIPVNSFAPGWVLTRPNDDYDDEVHKRMRLPEDIAPSALFLAVQTPDTLTGELVNAPDFDREHGIERPSAYERLRG